MNKYWNICTYLIEYDIFNSFQNAETNPWTKVYHYLAFHPSLDYILPVVDIISLHCPFLLIWYMNWRYQLRWSSLVHLWYEYLISTIITALNVIIVMCEAILLNTFSINQLTVTCIKLYHLQFYKLIPVQLNRVELWCLWCK